MAGPADAACARSRQTSPPAAGAARLAGGRRRARRDRGLPRGGPAMKPLAGHRVAALGGTAQRSLARYLASLGAEIVDAIAGASFILDDDAVDAAAEGPIAGDVIRISVTTFGRGGPRSSWK